MKNTLNIFSNYKINNFLINLLSKYELNFLTLEHIDYKKHGTTANIILIINDKDYDKINFENLNDNYLIISNSIIRKLDYNNIFKSLNIPTPLNNIKNKIENFIQNLKIDFHDISIHDEKLINIETNSFCYLTKVELEILTYLIREKETSKNFIKENILKIKSNIETNSLESHLTRIRKKMNEIQTKVKIQTRNEKLQITT